MKSALIAGCDTFADPGLHRLSAPRHDVQALADVLADPAVGGFAVRRAENQTAAELTRAIEDFFSERATEETLFFYISGHGIKNEVGQLYFAATDTDLKRLKSTAVSASFIADCAKDSRASSQVLVIDSCFSGAFPKGFTPRGDGGIAAEDFAPSDAGLVVLTASTSVQFAFEGDADGAQPQSSVFTRCLVHGLRSGDADLGRDGKVTIDELYEYVRKRLRDERSPQVPKKWVYGAEGEIVVARNPQPLRSALPDEVGAATKDRNSSVRLGSIAELKRLALADHAGRALSAREALKELCGDDSRMVSSAAEETLRQIDPAEPDPEPPGTGLISKKKSRFRFRLVLSLSFALIAAIGVFSQLPRGSSAPAPDRPPSPALSSNADRVSPPSTTPAANVSDLPAEIIQHASHAENVVAARVRDAYGNHFDWILNASVASIPPLDPDSSAWKQARAFNAQGIKELGTGDFAMAKTHLLAAARLASSDVEIINNLGLALYRLSDFRQAEMALLGALDLSPKRVNAWANIADVYSSKGQYREAVGALLISYAVSPYKDKTRQALELRANDSTDPTRMKAAAEALRRIQQP